MKKICFFVNIKKKSLLETISFYKQDIDILNDLAYEVKIAIKLSDIDWSCDIIFIWWWTWAFFPVFISKLLRKKTVITGTFNFKCPNAESDYFRRPWHERLLIYYSVKNTNMNIFVSEKEMLLVREFWSLKNCVYSPHIVPTDKYFPIEGNLRKENMLLSICNLTKSSLRRKCLFEMIDTVKILIKKGIDIYYYIAGHEDVGYVILKEYIQSEKLEKNVLLLGEIDETKKISLMRECTIYFQLSKYEGFGLAIAEAMACGAPVITSDVGEVSNVVGNSGILCKNYNIEEIAEKIESLLKKRIERENLSKRARAQILEKFQYSRRLNDFENILSNLLIK